MVAHEQPGDDVTLPSRPFTRAEYERLAELGFFEDERIELLNGRLVPINPQGAPHANLIRKLTRLLILAVGDRAFVLPQLPLAAADDSEPEPDLAVVPPGDYEREHPRTALLVIEISDSSARKDRNIKAPIYAAAAVAEFWIVLVSERVVEVHREPRDGRYGRVETVGRGAAIDLVALPGIRIATDDFL